MLLGTLAVKADYAKRVLIGFLTLLVGDGLWLGVISKHFGLYAKAIDNTGWGPMGAGLAIALYALISAAFAALMRPLSVQNALILGACAGFAVFTAFNITAVFIHDKWSVPLALVDTTYGTLAWSAMVYAQYTMTQGGK